MFLGLKFKEKNKEEAVLNRTLEEMQFLRDEISSIKSQLERLHSGKGDILGEDSALVELAAGVSGEGVYWQSRDIAEAGDQQEEKKNGQVDCNILVVNQDNKCKVEQITDEHSILVEIETVPDNSETIEHEAAENKNVIDDIINLKAVGGTVEVFIEKALANIKTIYEKNDENNDDKKDGHSASEGQAAVTDNTMIALSEDMPGDADGGDWSVVKPSGRKATWWKLWQKVYIPKRSV